MMWYWIVALCLYCYIAGMFHKVVTSLFDRKKMDDNGMRSIRVLSRFIVATFWPVFMVGGMILLAREKANEEARKEQERVQQRRHLHGL